MIRKTLFALGLTLTLSCAALFYTGGAQLTEIGGKMPQFLIEKSWQKAIKTGESVKPWPWSGSSPVAKLIFPARNESFVVMQGHRDSRILKYAPGWHDGTEKPGERGISLIAGRGDTKFGSLRDIPQGTVFQLQTLDGSTRTYIVDSLIVTGGGEIHVPVKHDESIILLSTSYPSENWGGEKDINYVVVAREYKAPPQMTSEMTPQRGGNKSML